MSSLPTSLFLNRAKELGYDGEKILSDVKTEGFEPVMVKYSMETLHNPKAAYYLAGALQVYRLYNDCPVTIDEYLDVFESHMKEPVVKYIRENKENFEKIFDFENDFRFGNLAVTAMAKSYLGRPKYESSAKEIPQFMKMRISSAVAGPLGWNDVKECFSLLGDIITFASPTMANAGFKDGGPTSCILDSVEDSLDGIYDALRRTAMSSKNGAGIGIDVSLIRCANSAVGRAAKSNGLHSMLKLFDTSTGYTKQGNLRQGATAAGLRICHYDAPKVIQACDTVEQDMTRFHYLHIALMTSDIFWKMVESGGDWWTFCPKYAPGLMDLHGREFEKRYIECVEKAQKYNSFCNKETTVKIDLDSVKKSISESIRKKEMYEHARETIISCEAKLILSVSLEDISSAKTALDKAHKNLSELSPPSDIDDLIEKKCSLEKELKEVIREKHKNYILAEKYKAIDVARQIVSMMKKRGFPYLNNGCSINRKNPNCNVGPVRSLNLCQEIAEPSIPGKHIASCNLMSICLSKFVENGEFNFLRFGKVVHFCIRMLNRVIAIADNADDRIKESNKTIRPVGLGVNGYAEMLAKLDLTVVDPSSIPTDEDLIDRYEKSSENILKLKLNPKVLALVRKIWSCMYLNALISSSEQVKVYGKYRAFDTSPYAEGRLQYHFWQEEEKELGRNYPFSLTPDEPSSWGQKGDWNTLIKKIQKHGLANSLHLCIMPTATSSQYLDVSESIEHHVQNIYVRRLGSGDAVIINFEMVDDLEKLGLWNKDTYDNIVVHDGSILYLPEDDMDEKTLNRLRYVKEKYRTMWEIPQMFRMVLAAQMQVFIDQSISFNLYFENEDEDVVLHALHYAWSLGLKSLCYYLRSKASTTALKLGYKDKKHSSASAPVKEKRIIKMFKEPAPGEICESCSS